MEGELRIFGEKGTLEVQPWNGWKLRGTDEDKENVTFSSRSTIAERALVGMRGALSEFVRAIAGGTRTRSSSGIGASQSEDHRTGLPDVPPAEAGTLGVPNWNQPAIRNPSLPESDPVAVDHGFGLWLQISRISPMRRNTSPSCVSCSAWSSKARQ